MFYDENTIKEKYAQLKELIADLPDVVKPMPLYMTSPNWTDENREKHGFTKDESGSWVKYIKMSDWLKVMENETLDLFIRNRENYNKMMTANRKNYEMEYGLRVAQKSLLKALDMKEENDSTE